MSKKIMDLAPEGGECFVQIYGANIGSKHDLTGLVVTIGRDPDNGIVLDTDSVSRRHARIESYNGQKWIVDLGSTNGTYLNDKPAVRCKLNTGDLVKIGDTIFKFLAGRNIESAYHEEIYRMTIHDGLTQIHNKRYLIESLDREFSRSKRYHRGLALIMFDIDHFKATNDRFGHLTGDYVLKDVATVVKNRIRREEVFARYGGEEFAIILPETDRKGARDFGEIVRRLIEAHHFEFEGNVIPTTISVGIGHIDDQMARPLDLVRIADENLYAAKRQGRNRVAD
jgi:diguanylate cyclase (GGDEF)-like protein